MKKSTRTLLYSIGGCFFIIFDQYLKWLVQRTYPIPLIPPLVSWEYFENTGVAFSIPIPHTIAALLTPIFLIGLFSFFLQRSHSELALIGGVLLFCGAISNYIDRILHGFTIDYLRIYTSVINTADVLIVLGVFLFLWGEKKERKV